VAVLFSSTVFVPQYHHRRTHARARYCSVAGRVQEVAGIATVVKSLPAPDLLLDGTSSGVLPAAGLNANRGRPKPSAQAPSLERIPPLISPRPLPPQQRSASHALLFPIIFRMATDAATKLPPVRGTGGRPAQGQERDCDGLNDGRRLADVVASLWLAGVVVLENSNPSSGANSASWTTGRAPAAASRHPTHPEEDNCVSMVGEGVDVIVPISIVVVLRISMISKQ
jgi:hypothetical protein